jgi:hypothetical protein
MNAGIERRRSTRAYIDAAAEMIWKDEAGNQQYENGRIIDCSTTGASIASPQALPASSHMVMRASGIGILALSLVRSCSWYRTQYRLGIEFLEKAVLKPTDTTAEPEYHELLRAGAAGEGRRLDQLYGQFEARYGAGSIESGHAEIFKRIKEAYRILKIHNPYQQAESGLSKPIVGFGWPEGLRELKDKRLAVLGLLYKKRMSDHKNASLSARELESLTGLRDDEIGFIVWYLREKGAIALNDYSSDYAICAPGVDILEAAQAEMEEQPAGGSQNLGAEPAAAAQPARKKNRAAQ